MGKEILNTMKKWRLSSGPQSTSELSRVYAMDMGS